MDRYLPPAGFDDFSRAKNPESLHQGWHDQVTSVLAQIRNPKQYNLASPLFYDHLADESGVPDGDPQAIPWNGFPLRLLRWYGRTPDGERLAYRAAEVILEKPVFGLYTVDSQPLPVPFRVQDEYCEWHVEREGRRIRRISFTCEPPEYWEFLARNDFDLVHRLYRELLQNDTIPADELRWPHDVFEKNRAGELVRAYARGDYNPRNVWNTRRGAVHLTHPANSLYAEIVLASDGTIGWPLNPPAGTTVDEIELMCCAGRGGINRSSDPLILRDVFSFARQGLSVALHNPIGLYMAPFDVAGLLDSSGNPIGDQALSMVRASADGSRILRAEVRTPDGAPFTLDECTLDGDAMEFGGQIARNITMRLFGVAKVIPGTTPREVLRCPQLCCPHPEHTEFRGTFPVKDFPGCGKVSPARWEDEAYDVPQVTDAEVSVVDAVSDAALVGDAAAEAASLGHPLIPLGRRVAAVDEALLVEIEE